ncbi:hypothetical protein FVA95_27470 [Pseudonocardia sp. EV170527-09]|uniref:DUF6545 domain-containing protein n=1 Tax=Pseudonocardia sp. EV170527-09 TaxID=2603411 RepID=UPI0011F1E977|nr:DUF6545 domain-containing protein [Pseudonocardia sp. EV170527-09]KAA1012202.1 hypothetical protein FVA95_27470 [Pseudonocardia sp. EV170527-09]
MHLTLSLVAATTLLLAAVLGLRRRTQPAVGITVAAFFAGVAAVLGAIPLPEMPTSRAYLAAGVLIAIGLAGTGLFTTASALSRRLYAISPIAAGGGVLLGQILLIVDGALHPLIEPRTGGSCNPQLAMLTGLTLAWPMVGAGVLIGHGRRVLRYIPSTAMQTTLRLSAALFVAALSALAVLAALQLLPATSPGARGVIAASDVVMLCCATLLGLGLVATRLSIPLQPVIEQIRAAVLFHRLRGLEQVLVSAVPSWKQSEVIAQPSLLRERPDAALYARMVVIWDTTRALLSRVPTQVVSAAVDFAHENGSGTSPDRRAALAEASWLAWALRGELGDGPDAAFQVLDPELPPRTGELLAEARLQVEVATQLRHGRLVEPFLRHLLTIEAQHDPQAAGAMRQDLDRQPVIRDS